MRLWLPGGDGVEEGDGSAEELLEGLSFIRIGGGSGFTGDPLRADGVGKDLLSNAVKGKGGSASPGGSADQINSSNSRGCSIR